MAARLVIRCAGLAVEVSAPRVVALPLHPVTRGNPCYLLGVLCLVTFTKKQLVLAVQILVRLDEPEFGDKFFQLGSALRDDHADRLAHLESHRQQFAG